MALWKYFAGVSSCGGRDVSRIRSVFPGIAHQRPPGQQRVWIPGICGAPGSRCAENAARPHAGAHRQRPCRTRAGTRACRSAYPGAWLVRDSWFPGRLGVPSAFRSYDAVTNEKLLSIRPLHISCASRHCASFRRARIDGVRSRSENRSMLCRGISSVLRQPPRTSTAGSIGDFAPQGPRYQTGTLGLFDQAKSALAIFFSCDRQDRTQGYLRELEPALDLLERSGRRQPPAT